MAWSKESRHARGYDSKWDKIRRRILRRDNELCQCGACKAGYPKKATEVDHIVSKAKAKRLGWTQEQIDADSNLQSLNHECHKAKTAAEQGRKLKPKVRIGLDGWPITEKR